LVLWLQKRHCCRQWVACKSHLILIPLTCLSWASGDINRESRTRKVLSTVQTSLPLGFVGQMQIPPIPPNPFYLLAQAVHSITYGDLSVKWKSKTTKKAFHVELCMFHENTTSTRHETNTNKTHKTDSGCNIWVTRSQPKCFSWRAAVQGVNQDVFNHALFVWIRTLTCDFPGFCGKNSGLRLL